MGMGMPGMGGKGAPGGALGKAASMGGMPGGMLLPPGACPAKAQAGRRGGRDSRDRGGPRGRSPGAGSISALSAVSRRVSPARSRGS